MGHVEVSSLSWLDFHCAIDLDVSNSYPKTWISRSYICFCSAIFLPHFKDLVLCQFYLVHSNCRNFTWNPEREEERRNKEELVVKLVHTICMLVPEMHTLHQMILPSCILPFPILSFGQEPLLLSFLVENFFFFVDLLSNSFIFISLYNHK